MHRIRQRWPVVPTVRDTVPAAVLFALLLILLHLADGGIVLALRRFAAGAEPAMRWVTRFGESDWILVPGAVVGLLCILFVRILPQPSLRRAAAEVGAAASFVVLGVGLPSLATALLKRLVGRARPTLFDPVGDYSFLPNWSQFDYQSFPSGHATTAFALAMVAGFLAPRLFWPALAAAVAIACSRMALGVHYLTDVTGGAVLGTLGAYLVRNWFADRRWVFRWRADGQAVPRLAAVWRAFRRPRTTRQPGVER
jgi:undecaprenyl-diphosphatase